MDTKWRTEESLYRARPSAQHTFLNENSRDIHSVLSLLVIPTHSKHNWTPICFYSTWNQCSSSAQFSLFSSPCGIITQSQREIEIWTDNESCFPIQNRHICNLRSNLAFSVLEPNRLRLYFVLLQISQETHKVTNYNIYRLL